MTRRESAHKTHMSTGNRVRPRRAGFTLAELLVASTLIVIVLGTVYTSFSTTIRLWRIGEANLATYQDARTSLAIVTRELRSALPGAAPLFAGTDRMIEFYAVVPPMDLDLGETPRLLRIRYRTRAAPGQPGARLMREEATVEDPLVIERRLSGEVDVRGIRLGRPSEFELAAGVHDFSITYIYLDDEEDGAPLSAREPGPNLVRVARSEHIQGQPAPNAVEISLTLEDPNTEAGRSSFTCLVPLSGLVQASSTDFSRAMRGIR